MELFEQIRREYEHGVGTIRAIAKKLGIHRRMVRQAFAFVNFIWPTLILSFGPL